MHIERPPIDDAETLAALHIACWREAYGELVPAELLNTADLAKRTQIWRTALADPGRIVLAAYDGEKPAGFIMAGPPSEALFDGIDGHVAALYILASHQRRGIGRRSLALAAGQWLAQGGASLALGVLAENHKARRFYEALGGRLVKTGIHEWDGHPLSDAIYVFEDLGRLAAMAG